MALVLENMVKQAAEAHNLCNTEELSALIAKMNEWVLGMESDRKTYASYIERARNELADDDLEIDDEPMLSPAVGDEFDTQGVWVNCWVWVPLKSDEDD